MEILLSLVTGSHPLRVNALAFTFLPGDSQVHVHLFEGKCLTPYLLDRS